MNRRLNTAVVLCSGWALLALGGCSSPTQADAGSPSPDVGASHDAGRDGGVDAGPGCDAGSMLDPATGACVLTDPCGGTGTYDPATGECIPPPMLPPPTSLVDADGGTFEAKLIDAYCDYLIRCHLDVHDKDLCVKEQTARGGEFNDIALRVSLAQTPSATGPGNEVSYDGVKATECLGEVQDAGTTECTTTPMPKFGTPDCQGVFTGRLGANFVCSTDAECESGYFCLLPQPLDPAGPCVGSCQKIGDRCSTDSDCALNGKNSICVDPQRCQPATVNAGSLHDPCGTHDRCSTTDVNMNTRMPLFLGCFTRIDATTMTSTRSCEELSVQGACDDNQLCAPGSVCQNRDATGFSCHPVAGVASGQSCHLSDPSACSSSTDVCVATAAMAANGTCLPSKKLGEACTYLLECGGVLSANVCSHGAGGSSVCVPRPSTGPCPGSDAHTCDPMVSYCDMSTMSLAPTCQPFKAVGDGCSTDAECGPWYQSPTCRPGADGVTNVCFVSAVAVCQ
jgi:hypothetical protein